MGIKLLAWWTTNSNAVLSDALESIVNIVAGSFTLFSLYLSAQPRDNNHPYGHGKVEFLSAGLEGGLIFLAGIGIMAKAAYNLFVPQPLEHLGWGMVWVGISGLVNYLLGSWISRQGTKSHSLALQASGQHLQTDGWTSAGLLLGLGLVWWTQFNWMDNLLALGFAAFILYSGYGLVRQAVAGIMDETDPQLVEAIVGNFEAHRLPQWIDIHNLRLIKYGPTLHLDCHMTLPWYFNARQTHTAIRALEDLGAKTHPQPLEFFVHVDPCQPVSCPHCLVMDCPERTAAFVAKVPWTVDNVMKNLNHEALD